MRTWHRSPPISPACPGSSASLQAVGGDLPAFYRRVRELAKLDQQQRDARSAGCTRIDRHRAPFIGTDQR